MMGYVDMYETISKHDPANLSFLVDPSVSNTIKYDHTAGNASNNPNDDMDVDLPVMDGDVETMDVDIDDDPDHLDHIDTIIDDEVYNCMMDDMPMDD